MSVRLRVRREWPPLSERSPLPLACELMPRRRHRRITAVLAGLLVISLAIILAAGIAALLPIWRLP